VFQLQCLKVDAYSSLWGISLDFVPHLTGAGAVAWHRSL
jgi:hypothetical protein